LVTKYDAHINIKICNSILAIKYLYKYIYKDHDWTTVTLSRLDGDNEPWSHDVEPVDKIKMYLNARYISSLEAV